MLVARLVKEVMGVEIEAMKIIVDNQSAIMLSKTLTHHNTTKHIDTHYHSIRDCVKDGRVIIKHVKTKDQLADILTKALGRVKFLDLCAKIGVKKAWEEEKIKEDNLGIDFPSYGTTSRGDAATARAGKHPSRTNGMQSTGPPVPANEAPCGM